MLAKKQSDGSTEPLYRESNEVRSRSLTVVSKAQGTLRAMNVDHWRRATRISRTDRNTKRENTLWKRRRKKELSSWCPGWNLRGKTWREVLRRRLNTEKTTLKSLNGKKRRRNISNIIHVFFKESSLRRGNLKTVDIIFLVFTVGKWHQWKNLLKEFPRVSE